jgi:mannose-1-phosphate guanylyltransferase
MLAHLLDHLRAAGGAPIVVNTHHRPEKINEFVDEYGLKLTVSHEPYLLGTAGGLARVRHCFGPSPVVVWNGDILAQPNLQSLVAATERAVAAMAVIERPIGEGTCGLGADGRVVRLRGERFGDERSGADYLGVLALAREQLERLPDEGCLVGDYLLPKLRANERVLGIAGHGGFSDIGTPSVYLRENLRWLDVYGGKRRNFVHPTARVASGVSLVDTIVGAGAVVTGRGRLERVVVWPGAAVEASLEDAIVTQHHGTLRVLHAEPLIHAFNNVSRVTP